MVAPPVPTTKQTHPVRAAASSTIQPKSLRKRPRDLRLVTILCGTLVVLSLLVATLLAAHLGTRQLVYPHPAVKVTYANAGATVHPNDKIQLSVAPTAGHELTYAWNFGDGATATGAQVTHSYSKYGYYTVSVTATDPAGQKAVEQVVVTVVPPAPKAVFSVSHDRWYDYIVTVNAGSSVGTDLRYYWDFGDGESNSSGLEREITHNYPGPGSYGLTLTVVDGAGQRSTTTIVVTVKGY